MDEFSLINQFFKNLSLKRGDVIYGIGDDAACLQIPLGMNLLVSTDTLVSGVHFLSQWNAYDIACKAVMANVSDMAAMAAKPCWITLALTLPELNLDWLQAFSEGLKDSLDSYNIELIGGDTTKGPLSITLTIMGVAPFNQAIRRNGAKPGDIIVVSGPLGAAALAVHYLEKQHMDINDQKELMDRLLHPKPRIDLIPILRAYASAAIDISDGLSADLNHICEASNVGACLTQDDIPLHPLLKKYCRDEAVDLALCGGDDYELCFTVAPSHFNRMLHELNTMDLMCYPIGIIEENMGLRINRDDSACDELPPRGYSHF